MEAIGFKGGVSWGVIGILRISGSGLAVWGLKKGVL